MARVDSPPRPATTTTTVRRGTRVTVATHPPARRPDCLVRAGRAAGLSPSFFSLARGTSREPMKPNIAGSRVRATTTATRTAAAAQSPMIVRKGMPVTDKPTRAIITVIPAKSTAEPDVAMARPVDSSGTTPSANCWRCRDRMKSE